MKRVTVCVSAAWAVGLTGCGCGFRGTDGVIEFGSSMLTNYQCWSPSIPLAVGSVVAVSPSDESEDVAESYTYGSDDPGVATLNDTGLRALGVGRTTVRTDSSIGRSDKFEVDIVEARSARLLDPFTAVFIDGAFSDDPSLSGGGSGDAVWLHPDQPIRLVQDQPLDLWLALYDDGGRRLAWTESAVELVSSSIALDVPPGLYTDLRVRGEVEGNATLEVRSSTGAVLANFAIEVLADAVPASIEIGAVLLEPDPERSVADIAAILRTVVRDANGEPIWQPSVDWSLDGDGRLGFWRDDYDCGEQPCPMHRPDIAMLSIDPAAGEDFESYRSCVTATIAGVSAKLQRSIQIDPSGVSVSDGECGGCACSGAVAPSNVAWFVALACWRKRRRRVPEHHL